MCYEILNCTWPNHLCFWIFLQRRVFRTKCVWTFPGSDSVKKSTLIRHGLLRPCHNYGWLFQGGSQVILEGNSWCFWMVLRLHFGLEPKIGVVQKSGVFGMVFSNVCDTGCRNSSFFVCFFNIFFARSSFSSMCCTVSTKCVTLKTSAFLQGASPPPVSPRLPPEQWWGHMSFYVFDLSLFRGEAGGHGNVKMQN